MVILVIGASSCNPTKYVPKDETLLDENRIIINREGIKKVNLPLISSKNPIREYLVSDSTLDCTIFQILKRRNGHITG